jgi:hypothetical protein
MSNHLDEVHMQAHSTRPRDTRAWQLQVWTPFGLAVFLCGVGLAWLPGQDLDRASAMKNRIASLALAAGLLLPLAATARTDASALSAVSALPVASVAVAGSAAAASVVVLPVALSTAGSVLVVRAVESTARGTVYLLERASDGARASVEVAGRSAGAASLAVGSAVTVSVIGAGVVLSAAGEVIAFIPNALGRALLHNERVAH